MRAMKFHDPEYVPRICLPIALVLFANSEKSAKEPGNRIADHILTVCFVAGGVSQLMKLNHHTMSNLRVPQLTP